MEDIDTDILEERINGIVNEVSIVNNNDEDDNEPIFEKIPIVYLNYPLGKNPTKGDIIYELQQESKYIAELDYYLNNKLCVLKNEEIMLIHEKERVLKEVIELELNEEKRKMMKSN
eukprot:TRINITY_DN606_c0_g2_i1.p1 TRINITY_DN606_c0_g2~~TRINITY_DN606_c0_g2_i1.p1  ORF type:complete len:116 (+),score=37.35 TRINITY_DN606_c0_g2_i1:126-473(+)